MVIQHLIVPLEAQYSESFFRGGRADGGRLVLKKGETLSTDTYFNSFSYTVYRDFTDVSAVSAEVKFSGNIRLELCLYDGSESVLAERTASSGSPAGISASVELSGLPDGAFLFFRVYALSDSVIYSGGYSSDAAPQDDIECCVVMCTYKREEYALRNAELLCTHPFTVIRKLLIIDNGKTLPSDKFPDDKAEVIPNRNYGGSGGFTRGMLEAHRRGYSHVILMDDDISFYPEVFERMTVLISLLKLEHRNSWVSAAMLSQREPYRQFAMGCYWHNGAVENRGHALDIRDRDKLLSAVQSAASVNYGAWWCLAMPTSVFDETGYPFPFFIKFDDVEYGIRQNHADIITMNGIAVTHEDFDSKFSMHLIYYECRNLLVTCAADTNASTSVILLRLFSTAGKQLLLYRYDALRLVIRAFDDFLKGVDFFLNCDEEKLNAEIMDSVPKPVIIQSDTGYLPESCGSKRVFALQLATLGGHLIPSVFMKKNEADISAMTDDFKKCFGHMTINQHAGQNRCYVMKRSFRRFIQSVGSIIRIAFKVLFLYPGVKKEYMLRKSEITSESFWETHLGLGRK